VGLHTLRPAHLATFLFNVSILVLWGSFPVAQLYRYVRISDATQRQQTKWVVFGVAVTVAGVLTTIFTVGAAEDLPPKEVGPKMLSMLLMDAFMLFIPLSIGFAVLRSRLFDRRGHKLYPRLRFSHGDLGRRLFRRRDGDPGSLPRHQRPRAATATRRRCIHPCYRGPVQPLKRLV
jgi:hypothetical protein